MHVNLKFAQHCQQNSTESRARSLKADFYPPNLFITIDGRVKLALKAIDLHVINFDALMDINDIG